MTGLTRAHRRCLAARRVRHTDCTAPGVSAALPSAAAVCILAGQGATGEVRAGVEACGVEGRRRLPDHGVHAHACVCACVLSCGWGSLTGLVAGVRGQRGVVCLRPRNQTWSSFEITSRRASVDMPLQI